MTQQPWEDMRGAGRGPSGWSFSLGCEDRGTRGLEESLLVGWGAGVNSLQEIWAVKSEKTTTPGASGFATMMGSSSSPVTQRPTDVQRPSPWLGTWPWKWRSPGTQMAFKASITRPTCRESFVEDCGAIWNPGQASGREQVLLLGQGPSSPPDP